MMKNMYKKSKECAHLDANDGICLKCVFWSSGYSYCIAYSTEYDKAKMELLLSKLKFRYGKREEE